MQLHYDNLVALAGSRRELKPAPSYWTLRRFLKAHGLVRRRRRGSTAVVVVHHAKKGANRLRDGQALRGTSEFHAWGATAMISLSPSSIAPPSS